MPVHNASESTATPAREAASVILLRDHPDGRLVFVQHRVASMDFAAGMVVFPGGRVDPADSVGWDFPQQLLAEHASAWTHTSIGGDNAGAGAARLLSAALREVLEEAGVALPAATLTPWANWVTPSNLPKRFDTFFYVTILPANLEPLHQTTEATHSGWMRPEDILAAEDRGELRLMPPTLVLLDELVAMGPATRIAPRPVHPVLPQPGDDDHFFRERLASRSARE